MTTAAVVGCGDISVVHLEAIAHAAGAELVGVCDIDRVAADAAAGRHRVAAFGDHRELLRQLRPDVVHVCTPHDQHATVAVDSLRAGASVLLEKPLAETVAAGDHIARVAAEHPELKVGVCFQNRYNATSRAMRGLLDSGRLGAVQGGSASVLWNRTPHYYKARPWRGQQARSGGGVLINQAIHTLDLLQWLVGDITDVRGDVGHYGWDTPDIDVEDTAHLVLQHGPSIRSLFYASNLYVTDAPITVEVLTEGARLHLQGELTITYAGGRTETVRESRPDAESVGRSYWGTSHRLLVQDFYDRLGDPEPFWIGPAEAMKTQRALSRIYVTRRG